MTAPRQLATPCQDNPSLWDVDHKMTGHDIAACQDACLNHCDSLTACRNYLHDMDTQGQPVHGVIAGQVRPWGPDADNRTNGPRANITRCPNCGDLCMARSTLLSNPDRYPGVRVRKAGGLCEGCFHGTRGPTAEAAT